MKQPRTENLDHPNRNRTKSVRALKALLSEVQHRLIPRAHLRFQKCDWEAGLRRQS